MNNKLPHVDASPVPFDEGLEYEVLAWRTGTPRCRYVKPGANVEAFAVAMFRVLNAGTSLPATWTSLGDERKLSFARPWEEPDTVVYVAPIVADENNRTNVLHRPANHDRLMVQAKNNRDRDNRDSTTLGGNHGTH